MHRGREIPRRQLPQPNVAITVVCGILVRGRSVLLARRPSGAHLAGTWEFPGGKVREAEELSAALARELREEIGVEVSAAVPLAHTFHRYEDRDVTLWYYLCRNIAGEPANQEGQDLRWVDIAEIPSLPTPAANREVLELLAEQLEP